MATAVAAAAAGAEITVTATRDAFETMSYRDALRLAMRELRGGVRGLRIFIACCGIALAVKLALNAYR